MFEPLVKEAESQTVAYTVMRGSFSQIPSGYEALYGRVGLHRLQPVGMPHTIRAGRTGCGRQGGADASGRVGHVQGAV